MLIVFSCYWLLSLLWFNKIFLGNYMGRMLPPWAIIMYNFKARGLYKCSLFPREEERTGRSRTKNNINQIPPTTRSLPLQFLTIFYCWIESWIFYFNNIGVFIFLDAELDNANRHLYWYLVYVSLPTCLKNIEYLRNTKMPPRAPIFFWNIGTGLSYKIYHHSYIEKKLCY